MQDILGTLIGKSLQLALKARRGGGHALPGLVVEKLFPNYVEAMLKKLPEGIVIITGTNGKTTTTKIVTHLLKASGKKVLTNPTGSNLTRGIASSLARRSQLNGRLNYDLAVLEVDEAAARKLVRDVKPRWVLGLNVSRDQLDRFGEVDTIAAYIKEAMAAATEGVIANASDPHLARIGRELAVKKGGSVSYFGAAPKLAKYFPSDYQLASVEEVVKRRETIPRTEVGVELEAFRETSVKYRVDGQLYDVKLRLSGQHNFLNAAAAIALCRRLLPAAEPQALLDELARVELAFGRGETYRLQNGAEVELVLVKNPASFNQALLSYGGQRANLVIAINDNIADGRDVSWLWDVDLSPLNGRKVLAASGTRAADMALRLSYSDIETWNIEPKLARALRLLAASPGPKVVLATYTAMLALYKLLNKQGKKV